MTGHIVLLEGAGGGAGTGAPETKIIFRSNDAAGPLMGQKWSKMQQKADQARAPSAASFCRHGSPLTSAGLVAAEIILRLRAKMNFIYRSKITAACVFLFWFMGFANHQDLPSSFLLSVITGGREFVLKTVKRCENPK